MKSYYNNYAINEILEYLDNQISCILDRVRRYIEELNRGVPFSQKKAEVRVAILYQTRRRNIEKGRFSCIETIKKRVNDLGILYYNMTLEEINDYLKQAK